ncbi:hypothetical protein OROMI_007813 [Orobanche minor]
MIQQCVCNAWFSTIINGEPVGYFKSHRGLRLGDPISPLIFVLAEEYFSRCIDFTFSQNPSMFFITRKNVHISHLAYVDDTLLFVKATSNNLQILKHCFQHFEGVSGQKINEVKSSFLLHNPTPHRISTVNNILGYTHENFPFNYLGVPIGKGNPTFNMFNNVVLKIQNKICTWNHHLLSLGGRIELIKSVLHSVIFYFIQVIKPPKNVIMFFDRFLTYFCGGLMIVRKKFTGPRGTTWNRLCYPTAEGSLGCRDLNDIIQAAEYKMWWRFRANKNDWSNLLMSKYCKWLHPMVVKINPFDSPVWKRLCAIRSEVDKFIFWSSGDANVSFGMIIGMPRSITNFLGINVDIRLAHKLSLVRWLKPPVGWFKLNTDGAVKGNPGPGAAGGIVSDHTGTSVLCFWEFIGVQTNTFVELHGIWRGLQLCRDKGLDNIWVEVDSAIALKLIHNNSTAQWQAQTLIPKIHILLENLNTRFSHIYRDGNTVADFWPTKGVTTEISSAPMAVISVGNLLVLFD